MSRGMEYVTDVTAAFGCEHTMTALEAYASIRRAITITDHMSDGALVALQQRVDRARAYCADDAQGVSNAAAGRLLDAYSQFLQAIIWEQQHV